MSAEDCHGERACLPDEELTSAEVPSGIGRRPFFMRSAREMSAKYKETSEGGLAVSMVLC